MNAKLKFGIHQFAVKVHLGECSLNYIGRYNTKWCAGSDLITERPFLHTRSVISLHQRWPRVSGGNGNGRGEPNERSCDVTFPVTWLFSIGLHDSDVKWRPP